jgi:ribosomal protein L7/L12
MTAKVAGSSQARQEEEFQMPTFTIDADDNITAYDTPQAATKGSAALPRFSSQAELAQLTADWPGSRWIEVWNSISGHKPVSKLGPAKQAAARVWAALQRVANTPHSKPNKATKPATKAKTARKGAKKSSTAKSKKTVAASEPRESKKAEVIALLRRAKGVSLSEIQKLTGWQKHTIRGFISLLGSKAGLKIISTRTDAGERSYRTAK